MLAASGETDAAGVGEQVLRQFAAPPEDDVAVVVIRVPGPDAEQRRGGLFRRWRLAPAADSVRRARKLVTEACTSWERDPAVVELIVSELVRSEEHTSELQSRGHLVCRRLPQKQNR